MRVEKSAGGPTSLESAAQLLRTAKNPVILAGGGVVMGGAIDSVKALAEYLQVTDFFISLKFRCEMSILSVFLTEGKFIFHFLNDFYNDFEIYKINRILFFL